MFKLYPLQEEMIRQLLEHWENREKPIQQLLHERDLVHVGIDFGTKDQMAVTRYKIDGDTITVLDIETIDFKIRGKPILTIIDDEVGPKKECTEQSPRKQKNRRSQLARLNQSQKAKQELLDKFWAARSKRG